MYCNCTQIGKSFTATIYVTAVALNCLTQVHVSCMYPVYKQWIYINMYIYLCVYVCIFAVY